MRGRRPVLLVLRALGLGDLLTAVPALRGLRRAFPGHQHVLAAPAACADLVTALGIVDAHLPTEELAPVPLPAGAVDVAVNLHGRGPESHRLLRALAPRRLLAFAGDGVAGPGWRPDEHEVVRWCRLLAAHDVPADPDDLDVELAVGRPPADVEGATVIHPGAKAVARRWPPERFAAVAAAERDAGRQVVITGSAAERGLADAVAAGAGLGVDAVLAGRTGLVGLARTVAAAGRVVSGDTGVAHLATGLGTPSVVLFGPTSPAWWGPPPSRLDRHRVLWAGRTGDPHADVVDPGLLAITVGDVHGALGTLPAPEPQLVVDAGRP